MNACLSACLDAGWLASAMWQGWSGGGGGSSVQQHDCFPLLLLQCLSQSWNGVESQHESLSSQVRRLTSHTDTILRRCRDDVKICVPVSSTFAQYGPNAAFPGLVEISNHRGLCSCVRDVACFRMFSFHLRQLSSFLTPQMYFLVCLFVCIFVVVVIDLASSLEQVFPAKL